MGLRKFLAVLYIETMEILKFLHDIGPDWRPFPYFACGSHRYRHIKDSSSKAVNVFCACKFYRRATLTLKRLNKCLVS